MVAKMLATCINSSSRWAVFMARRASISWWTCTTLETLKPYDML